MIQISKTKSIESILSEYSKDSHIIIDVRSESEFAEDHIPGAVNLPVLNDKERAIVGTEYKKNPFSARQLGAKLIANNLKQNLEKVEELINLFNKGSEEKHKPFCHFVIYCWRGGMRSRSLFTVMDLIGYKTSLIDGGYKSYRSHVNHYFREEEIPETICIYGPSGSGKSELITNIIESHIPAIHFEKLANHKGSLLGGDTKNQPSQKQFESDLYDSIKKINNNYMVIEGESKKIGRLLLPERICKKMMTGKKIWVELPIEIRASRLSEEYDYPHEFILEKIKFLKQYLDGKIFNSITEAIAANDRYTAAYLLLKHHYDRHYLKGAPDSGTEREYIEIFKASSFEQLKQYVIDYLKEYYR